MLILPFVDRFVRFDVRIRQPNWADMSLQQTRDYVKQEETGVRFEPLAGSKTVTSRNRPEPTARANRSEQTERFETALPSKIRRGIPLVLVVSGVVVAGLHLLFGDIEVTLKWAGTAALWLAYFLITRFVLGVRSVEVDDHAITIERLAGQHRRLVWNEIRFAEVLEIRPLFERLYWREGSFGPKVVFADFGFTGQQWRQVRTLVGLHAGKWRVELGHRRRLLRS